MNSPSKKPSIGLLVVRSDDMDRLAAFYTALGFTFEKHSHPPCGKHYATSGTDCVFEIYKRKSDQPKRTEMFFGLNVSNVDDAVEAAVGHGGTIIRSAEDSEWGRSAIIRDLDGHRVMLSESR